MSTVLHAAPGKLSFGGLMTRILLILVLWAGLVYGTLHFVGYVLPRDYQISLANSEAAEAAAKAAENPPAPAPPAAAPAASSASAAAASAAPAASAPAPAAGAEKKLPKDPLLAGYNRTALTNVARFYAIVISVLCVGVIILQIFKYKHVVEEPAH
jgi:predicted lipid-binding transport protein (Tim44 family)